jgi:3-methyladenine DNA glycosylase/8-oxoguanine DNA glycosylase
MFLIFALRGWTFCHRDLGVRAAMKRPYNLQELPTPDEMEKSRRPGGPTAP